MGPTFCVVSVTVNDAPGTAAPGGSLTAVTARSAVGRLTWIVPTDARQLLVSLLSAMTPRSSAHARRKYLPAGVPVRIVTVTVSVERAPGASAGIARAPTTSARSEEHTSELQSRFDLVCRLL